VLRAGSRWGKLLHSASISQPCLAGSQPGELGIESGQGRRLIRVPNYKDVDLELSRYKGVLFRESAFPAISDRSRSADLKVGGPSVWSYQ